MHVNSSQGNRIQQIHLPMHMRTKKIKGWKAIERDPHLTFMSGKGMKILFGVHVIEAKTS